MYLAALLCEQFCQILLIREWRCQFKISIKCYFRRSVFFLSVYSVNCRLQLAGLGKKREETVKPTCFMSKATSVPQTPQTNHSQYSSPVEALNLIVESKSQPVQSDNSTIELAILLYCMTFDVTLRDD